MKKILIVNEASYLDTGYARYGRELLKRLHEKYEVAELACHHQLGNESHSKKAESIPWKIFSSVPPQENEDALSRYHSSQIYAFGKLALEETLAQFPADIICSFRDNWMDSWIEDSPFRPYFNHIQLAPVDAAPQKSEWLDFYSHCEGLLTYNNWSKKVLEDEGLYVHDSAPFAADEYMVPQDKIKCKKEMGISDGIIIGTVNRNQPRKLYDELFRTFSKFNTEGVYLYCHTAVLDQGSNLINLLLKYDIANKVYFTYKCTNCGHIQAQLYSNTITTCYKCGNLTSATAGPNNFVTNEELAKVFNCFDIYTQYSASEGLGMGQLEAAACKVPVISVDYSAMTDVVRKVGGYPISLISKKIDNETGRDFAIPDDNDLIRGWKIIIKDLKNKSELAYKKYHENYGWDRMAKPWLELIDKIPLKTWGNPIIKPIAEFNQHEQLDNRQYIKWLIVHVLGNPSKLGSLYEHRLVENLNMGCEGANGGHTRHQKVSRRLFYDRMKNWAEYRNFWEGKRESSTNRSL